MNQEKNPVPKNTQQSSQKNFLNKKPSEWNFKTFLLLGILLLLATKIIFDFVGFRASLGEAFKYVGSLLGYLTYGFILAYVLNACIYWMDGSILKKMKPGKKKQAVGIILAYALLVAFVAVLIFAIVPKLVESITDLAKMVPNLFDTVNAFYRDFIEGGWSTLTPAMQNEIVEGIADLKTTLIGLLNVDLIASMGIRVAKAAGVGVFNIFMTLLVSVYMLLEKDRVLVAGNRIVHGLFKPTVADQITNTGRKVDLVFKKYFAGKLLQAVVILVLSYIVLLIGRVDYAILFAVILGFTNLIPYIGPWIGGVPVVLISFVQDPWLGVRALICILIIQMLDNWFITPNIVGGQMGVSPLLVLVGLCVGGALFGFVGMIIGDALAAVAKVVFYDTYIEWKLRKRVEAGELPSEYGTVSAPEQTRPNWFKRAVVAVRNIFRKGEK